MIIVKKWIGALTAIALCATTSLLFTACGGGDGGSDSDDYYSYDDDDSFGSIIGSWKYEGYTLSGNLDKSITCKFNSSSGEITEVTYLNGATWKISTNEFSYTYDNQEGIINVRFDTGETETWSVLAVTSSTLYLNMKGSYYDLNKMSTETDYAPASAAGYHLTTPVIDVYFDSNSSIDPASSATNFVLVSASYERVEANKAIVTYYTKSNSSSEPTKHMVDLVFTSTTGGTYKYTSGSSGAFTWEKENAPVVKEAPSSVSYMTFTEWTLASHKDVFNFGAQVGNSVYLSSFSLAIAGSSYTISGITYSKTGSNTAKLYMKRTYKSYSSIYSTYTYYLTFTTSTGGTYSCYVSPSASLANYSPAHTDTGNFSLE